MDANQLIEYLAWSFYLAIFGVATVRAVRRPLRTNIDVALFFTTSALIIVLSGSTTLGLIPAGPVTSALSGSLLLLMAFLLFRLVEDFTDVPTWAARGSAASLVLLAAGAFAFAFARAGIRPGWFTALELAYLVALISYTIVAFTRESRRSHGVTSRRMRAVALGSMALVADFLISGLALVLPQYAGFLQSLADVAGLASGIGYFVGFAPPELLRHAWQQPELLSFLGTAADLPRMPDVDSIIKELERGAANAIGAPEALVGLWDAKERFLRFHLDGEEVLLRPDMSLTTGRAFITQQPVHNPNIESTNPLYLPLNSKRHTIALMAAPITAGNVLLGVLAVYASRAPMFADEDLALVELLADQAAVVLQNRTLIDEAAEVRAREEAARMKDDFLSAAAHDLKTPLTTLVAHTQLLERRALRSPDAPADLVSIQRLTKEAQRLKVLVLELLDATRAEQGRLVGERSKVDIVSLARETCSIFRSDRHECVLTDSEPIYGEHDPHRILQLLENLVENAVKYSPEGGTVRVNIWHEPDWNHITVSDEGIGIPAEDLSMVFERFHRGSNVDDRRFSGMGLGLFICKGIVEQHGGKIWANSTPGLGTTFHVMLPALAAPDSVVVPSPETMPATPAVSQSPLTAMQQVISTSDMGESLGA